MATTIKMRCSRVSQYDSGPATIREVQLVTTDRENLPLNPPEQVAYASVTAAFVDPNGADIEHDSLVDVVLTVGVEARGKGK